MSATNTKGTEKSLKIKEILESIKTLTLPELNDLASDLRSEFGIEGSMSFQNSSDEGDKGEKKEATPTKASIIIVEAIPMKSKLAFLKTLVELEKGTANADDFASLIKAQSNLNDYISKKKPLFEDLALDKAEEIKKQLEEKGAKLEMVKK
jgi:ribosomal protein L7/L12